MEANSEYPVELFSLDYCKIVKKNALFIKNNIDFTYGKKYNGLVYAPPHIILLPPDRVMKQVWV